MTERDAMEMSRAEERRFVEATGTDAMVNLCADNEGRVMLVLWKNESYAIVCDLERAKGFLETGRKEDLPAACLIFRHYPNWKLVEAFAEGDLVVFFDAVVNDERASYSSHVGEDRKLLKAWREAYERAWAGDGPRHRAS